MEPKAFISCSFDDEFKEERLFFKTFIESLNIETILIEEVGLLPIPEKIRAALDKADFMIVLLFTKPSDYILNEIGMAFSLRKKIIIAKEKTVDIGGIAPRITDFAIFDQANFWTAIPELSRVLLKIKTEYENNFTGRDLIIRKYVKSLIEITDEEICNTTEVKVLSLSAQLNEVNHGLLLYNECESKALKKKDLSVRILSPGFKSTVTEWSTDSSINFKLSFDPALRESETIRYMYRQLLANYYPRTKKQLFELVSNGKYHLDEPFCEKNYTISTPTEFLSIEILFKDSYKVATAKCDVQYYKANIKIDEELDRIKKNNFFQQQEFAGNTSLLLKIPYPKVFARYSIRWQPL